ncbi:hypothetical protein [Fusobacterium perfoetens]|uniref:hypothetical protein n=1 Tax=Fusobacterium perfoetens TaxID=852 RepID=UPI001F2A1435|nr:hypothetical protein [Fusobacterium perfoetens]MCF2611645.1 hypothetical protein [Fusobacterium perfoetens]
MQRQISTFISKLQDYKIKGIKYNGVDDKNGIICQVAESGEEFNIIRWLIHRFTLSIQYLTYEECENIIKELLELKKNRKLLIINKEMIENKGYIDFKEIKGNPSFSYEIKDISPKPMLGKPFYELSIKLNERIDL